MSEPLTALLACMDARLDAAGFLDLWPEAVHVFRNAGGRATDDALRSLAASCAMGTERIVVVHHTDCAMAQHSDEQIRDRLPDGAREVDFLTVDDPLEALARAARTVETSALLPPRTEVQAFLYDLDARRARPLDGLGRG